MPTPANTNLQFAESTMLNAFNKRAEESPWKGLFLKKRVKEGVAKFAMSFMGPRFEKLIAEITPSGYDSKSLTINTEQWGAAFEVSAKLLKNAEAMADPEFSMPFKQMGQDAWDAVDVEMTRFVEANGNDILGSAFWASGKVIPNSYNNQTITNTGSGAGVTAANFRTNLRAALAAIAQYKNVAGRQYHGSAFLNSKPILMYHPTYHSVVLDAFEAMIDSSGATNVSYKAAILRPNPYLTDENDVFWWNSNPKYPPLVWADEADPTFETNYTNSGQGDRDVLLRDRYTMASKYPFVVAFGSRLEGYRHTHA